MKKKRCRHDNTSWIIASGYYMWCYVCGALKACSVVLGTNHIIAKGRWTMPTGNKDKNPYNYFRKEIKGIKAD